MRLRTMVKFNSLLALVTVLALVNCGRNKPNPLPLAGTLKSSKGIGSLDHPFNEAEAVSYLVEQCGGCHAAGAPLAVTWQMPDAKELSAATLAGMDTSANVYQTMVNRFKDAPEGQQPTPMPPTVAADQKVRLGRMLEWFRENVPSAVSGAESIYGAASQFGSTVAINLTYQCGQAVTGREFITRLYLAAFGRPATTAEISQIPAAELEQSVTDSRRSELTSAIFKDTKLKNEFMTNAGGGLQLFAKRLSDAISIRPSPQNIGLSQAASDDLKNEFYQMLLKYIESKSYKDIFGTIAYLNSTNTSFLSSNNNYRRGGTVFAVLAGQSLMAQTNAPKGQQPDPMPSCVTTKDVRMAADDPTKPDGPRAPRGAMAIPRSGAFCQGCHLYKYLNVASYVFRPFDEYGLVYPATAFDDGQANNPYKDMVDAATAPGILNGVDLTGPAQPVTPFILKALFEENDKLGAQCIKDRSGKKIADVSNIGDLVKFMVGDGKVLVNGLSRYLPKVLLNLSSTNQEIVSAVASAYTKDNGMLLPIFEAFFNTQSFACAALNN